MPRLSKVCMISTITLDCDDPCFQITQGTIWDGTTLYKLYQEAYTPWDWQPKLMEKANRLGLECFSSPFDFTSVDFMESMNMPAYMVASTGKDFRPAISAKSYRIHLAISGLEIITAAWILSATIARCSGLCRHERSRSLSTGAER